MCYHTSQHKSKDEIERAFKREIKNAHLYETAFHLTGFDKPFLPVISSANPTEINMYRWRLVPEYVEDEKDYTANTLNARAEDLFTSAAYKKYWNNRVLIICSGFFEPHDNGGEQSESWYVKPKDDSFFTIGGIYSIWKGLPTFTIPTVPSSPLLSNVHNEKKRMPLILYGERSKTWLSKNLSQDDMMALMMASFEHDDKLEAYRVIDGVMNRKIDTNIPKVIQPYIPPPGQQARPLTLF